MITQVRKPNDVPQGPHIAIIVFKNRSVYHSAEGIWEPGHGYYASVETIPFFEYWVAENPQDAQIFLDNLYKEDAMRTDILVQHVTGESL